MAENARPKCPNSGERLMNFVAHETKVQINVFRSFSTVIIVGRIGSVMFQNTDVAIEKFGAERFSKNAHAVAAFDAIQIGARMNVDAPDLAAIRAQIEFAALRRARDDARHGDGHRFRAAIFFGLRLSRNRQKCERGERKNRSFLQGETFFANEEPFSTTNSLLKSAFATHRRPKTPTVAKIACPIQFLSSGSHQSANFCLQRATNRAQFRCERGRNRFVA